MNNNYKNILWVNLAQSTRFGRTPVLFCGLLFLMLFSSIGVVGQSTITPNYLWDSKKDLATVNFGFSGINSDDIVVSIATDPQGNVYTLSFGNGVDKRDSNGNIIKKGFIASGMLQNPLDLAIDKEGFIYIADYFAGGTTFADNGKIWIFNSSGTLLSNRTILTSYFRPMGIDVDDQNVYIAEYNAKGSQGPEKNEYSKIEVVNKFDASQRISIDDINGASYPKVPYRIAVDSQRRIFVSQAGNNNSQVLVYNSNLQNPIPLPDIISAGSVVIDKFGFIYVLEYAGRVDFEKFINYEKIGFSEGLSIAKNIRDGIKNNEFTIKIFNQNKVLVRIITDNSANEFNIEFPLDVTFDSCGKMFLDNSEIFGADTFLGYVPSRLEFDLEIYNRTPSFDSTVPVISCPDNIEVKADIGKNFATVNFNAPPSTDNCSTPTVTQTNGPTSGSQFQAGTTTEIEFTATDASGNNSTCSFTVTVFPADNTAPVAKCKPATISLNANGNATLNATQVYDGDAEADNVSLSLSKTSFTCTDLGNGNEVTLTVTDKDNSSLFDTCKAIITVLDDIMPVAKCIAPGKVFVLNNGSVTISTSDIDDGSSDNCEIVNREVSPNTFTTVGTKTVILTITDGFGKIDDCTTTIEVVDNTPPLEAKCKPVTIYIDVNGNATLTAAQVYDGDAEADNVSLSLSKTSFICADLGNGNQVTLTVTDKDDPSLFKTCTAIITVLDDIKPVANCIAPGKVFALNNGSVTISASDIDDGSNDNCEIVNREVFPNTFTTVGTKTVTLTITDGFGKIDDCTTTIEVVDNTPPLEAKCKPVTISLDVNGNATLTAAQVYGGDAEADNVSLSLSKTSFTCADLGNGNEVTLTVTDKDDSSLSETCKAIITVLDDIKPVAKCVAPGKEFVLNNGSVTISASDIDDGSSDNCEIVNREVSPNTFTTVGTKTITLTITDSSDNKKECTTTIEVVDNAPPMEAKCKPVTISLDANGNATLNATQVYDGDAEADNVSLSLSKTSFTCADLGNGNQVTLTVTDKDDSSLFDTCTAIFTVTDKIAPTVSCPQEILVEYTTEKTYTVPDFSALYSSSDNCSQTLSYSQNPAPNTVITDDTNATFRVGDENNNFIACQFKIEFFKNTELQILNCPGIQTFEVDSNCSYLIPDIAATINTNIEGAIITQNIAPGFSVNNSLTLTITAKFEDQIDTCEVELIAKDNIKPEIICPGDQNETFNPENGFSLPNYSLEAQASDNCAVAKIEQIPNVGTIIYDDTELTIRVEDIAGNVATCTFMVILTENNAANTPPIANADNYNTSRNITLSIPAVGILGNDSDADNDALTAILQTTTSNGSLILNQDGSFTYTPNNNFTGRDTFTYVANDGIENSNVTLVTITVNADPPPNAPPIANSDNYNTNQNITLSIPATGILGNDTDADSDDLIAILQSSTTNGNLTLNQDGSFIYIPNNNFTGEDRFIYLANDGTANSNVVTVIITVNSANSPNSAPISVDDIYSTLQNVSLSVAAGSGVLNNDSDANGDTLTAVLVTNVTSGTLTLNPDGSFIYISNSNYFGIDSFTYTANDGSLNSTPSTARIEVIRVSDNTVTCKESVTLEIDINGNASLNAGDLFTSRPADLQFSVSKNTFSCSDVGENTVTLTYSNSEIQGSCEIKVSVIDNIAPIINIQPLTISLNNFGSISITPEMIDNGTIDNCGELRFSLSKMTFSCKDLGENMLTFTATDNSGNVSSANVVVTITGNCEIIPLPEVEYIFIYPNPTPGPFQFATPTGVYIDRVEAYDFRGRIIMFKEFLESDLQYTMDLSGVQNAVYILKLFTSEGISIIRVIID